MNTPDFSAAAAFVAANARVLDRRRFQRLFEDGPAAPVRDAVAAYRNDDGGLRSRARTGLPCAGQPAGRPQRWRCTPWTRPTRGTTTHGPGRLRLARGGGPRRGRRGPSSRRPWRAGPTAPWWVPEEGHPASLVATGMIAGTLHGSRRQPPLARRRHRGHGNRIGKLDAGQGGTATLGGYEMFGVLGSPPARAGPGPGPRGVRPGRAADPGAEPGRAGSRGARRGAWRALLRARARFAGRVLFDDATVQAHLDHLAQGQKDDGGWTFNWPAWSPAAELDWRGFLTVDALRALRANGRL